jgi:DNA-binding transcriptional ArsR family regulator
MLSRMADESELQPTSTMAERRLDARSLRALAHPLRMQLLEMLSIDGPATATGLSERLGEKTGTVSWHLRHLADHGFIEEEAGRGTKRERWWRAVAERQVLRGTEIYDDPTAQGALSVLMRETVQRYFTRSMDALVQDWDDEWLGAAAFSDWITMRMTPAQLGALNAELLAVVERHAPPADAEPGPDARPVVVQLQSFPRLGHRSS